MTTTRPDIEATLERIEQAADIDIERTSDGSVANDGEVSSKFKDLREHLDYLDAVHREQIIPWHSEQFDQIREEDIALQPRIEQLRNEDAEIASAIASMASRMESASEFSVDAIARFAEQGSTLVRRVRAQEKAIRKWFSESLLRDRGFPSG